MGVPRNCSGPWRDHTGYSNRWHVALPHGLELFRADGDMAYFWCYLWTVASSALTLINDSHVLVETL